jgi:hypothetical protein
MSEQSQKEGAAFAEYIVSLAESSVTLGAEFEELTERTPGLDVDEFVRSAVSAFESELRSIIAG